MTNIARSLSLPLSLSYCFSSIEPTADYSLLLQANHMKKYAIEAPCTRIRNTWSNCEQRNKISVSCVDIDCCFPPRNGNFVTRLNKNPWMQGCKVCEMPRSLRSYHLKWKLNVIETNYYDMFVQVHCCLKKVPRLFNHNDKHRAFPINSSCWTHTCTHTHHSVHCHLSYNEYDDFVWRK